MNFTAGSGVLNVTAPPNGNIAPPGYYLLFILNSSGVPSVAQFVQLTPAPADQPPTGTITSPATDVTITAGQSVSYSGTGSDPDGTINAYSWSFPGGNPSSSNLANPGSVTYSTPGTYVTTLTVTDNAGLTDPNPPSRNITVNPAPDFDMSATPSSQIVVQTTSTSYSVTVSSLNGFSGTVSLSVSGLPSDATASFSNPLVTGSGSSTLTVTPAMTTPPGTYTLTITGASGGLSHSVNVTLMVI
jgi:PKD domain/Domain of unknown function (DUF1929)